MDNCPECGCAGVKNETAAVPKKYFQNVFAKFSSGGPVFSWNWFAAIFQLIWYMFKGMWPKVFLYALILWSLKTAAVALEIFSFDVILWAVAISYFGLMANYDYYLHKVKKEHFWPKAPYRKLMAPFWFLIVAALIYNGTVSLKYLMIEPVSPAELAVDGTKFTSVPGQWSVYKDPPHMFSLSAPEEEGENLTGVLSYSALRGTKWIGYIVEKKGDKKVYKGLVCLLEKKPIFGKFDSVEDKAVVKKARLLSGAGETPPYGKWLSRWVAVKPVNIEYRDFGGRKWGCLKNTIELNFAGRKIVTHMAAYWTVVSGKAVYVVSESIDPYKDEVSAQVESFINSFKAA